MTLTEQSTIDLLQQMIDNIKDGGLIAVNAHRKLQSKHTEQIVLSVTLSKATDSLKSVADLIKTCESQDRAEKLRIACGVK